VGTLLLVNTEEGRNIVFERELIFVLNVASKKIIKNNAFNFFVTFFIFCKLSEKNVK